MNRSDIRAMNRSAVLPPTALEYDVLGSHMLIAIPARGHVRLTKHQAEAFALELLHLAGDMPDE